ncbi:hypothetical protein T11_6585 [Trichinella zimbabwensis]|uniref:PiggyBac transposable element-derived protein domain-containing protein n=1 Tax=Trichinella zimbabwensis TaxID=268475 RepID=A0A0V1GY89_9BILA|nr:hypothetical protein T11_6585 [Trichinella zimbabwensis]
MSLTGSDSDSFLDILNDSLEESDIASDSDYVEKSDYDASSEFSDTFSSESETEEITYERSVSWIGSDHVCSWSKQEASRNVRTRAHNIYSGRQGPRSVAKTPCEIWWLFMTKVIIDVITLNTNIYVNKVRAKYVKERSVKDMDEDEIKALLGLLLLAGVFHSNRLNLCYLYNTDGNGLTMPRGSKTYVRIGKTSARILASSWRRLANVRLSCSQSHATPKVFTFGNWLLFIPESSFFC